MPNISFDIFFDENVVNITASRGKHAPKVKPQWKTRAAPKLPPKEPPAPVTAVFSKPTRAENTTEKAVQPKKPAPKLEVRITSYIGGYVDQVVGGALKAGGGFAGDAVGVVGDGINSFGSGVEKSIRRYGDGAKDYGNAIKDWTDADGPRSTTAANPLGLPNSITGGKRALGWSKSSSTVNSSPVYRAPSSVGTKAAIKPSSSVRRLPAQVSKVTNVPVAKKAELPKVSTTKKVGPSKVPVAGVTIKSQSSAKGKPSSNGVKKVPMAGPTMTKNQALAKKK